jgi:hypothetical protein
VKINIEDFREALDVVGDSAGQEAAICAQFALDLAVTAPFRTDASRVIGRRSRCRASLFTECPGVSSSLEQNDRVHAQAPYPEPVSAHPSLFLSAMQGLRLSFPVSQQVW